MKIIHCADIHLGSKLTSKFSDKAAKQRRNELRTTFYSMIDFAKRNDVKVIIFCGDVFDSDTPLVKDKDFFYDAVKNNPDIDFLYLKGNHDKDGSYIRDNLSNLKIFSSAEVTSYEYPDVVISAIEINDNNASSFYSMIELDKTKQNIFMLHGAVSNSFGADRIKLSELRDKGIDYLALGHLHSFDSGKLDERGKWAYSGCLEGRGFDECGEKGFVLLDTADGISPRFIPFARRTIHRIELNVSDCSSLYEIQKQLDQKTGSISKDDIVRVEIVGELNAEIGLENEDIASSLSSFFFADVKNKAAVKIDPQDYVEDKSLIGELVRGIYDNDAYTVDQKKQLAALGVRLLGGKAVEL